MIMNTFELQYNWKDRQLTEKDVSMWQIAPTEQQVTAQETAFDYWWNALGKEINVNFVVPRSAFEKGGEIAWGKTEELYLKCNTLKKFRVLSSEFCRRHPFGKSLEFRKEVRSTKYLVQSKK